MLHIIYVELNCHSEMSLAPKLDVAKRSIPFKRSTTENTADSEYNCFLGNNNIYYVRFYHQKKCLVKIAGLKTAPGVVEPMSATD